MTARDLERQPSPRARRLVRLAIVALLAGLVVELGLWGATALRERSETGRTTPRFDPPVWAGQNVPGACSGGFYARREQAIVLTIVAHCAEPGATLRDGDDRVIGVFGPRAQDDDCPAGRFCAPSDILALELAPDWIPWGHLDLVDLGAGGYRTIEAGARALSCSDIHVGDLVETNGREHFRSGRVVAIGPYEHETDTIFPCMIVTDIDVVVGDSGAAVLVDGAPGGIVSRSVGGRLGFTPLAEGLENLGLDLCTAPSCEEAASVRPA